MRRPEAGAYCRELSPRNLKNFVRYRVKSNDNVTESGWFYQMIMLPGRLPPFLSLVV